jgi:hypothetical protein
MLFEAFKREKQQPQAETELEPALFLADVPSARTFNAHEKNWHNH